MSRINLLLVATCCVLMVCSTIITTEASPHHQKHHTAHNKAHSPHSHSHSISTSTPPVWPLAWNATLIKIGPDSFPNDLQWTKLYFSNTSSRFDFYTSYQGEDQQWNCNFTILFTQVEYEGIMYPMIYHIYPYGGPDDPEVSVSAGGARSLLQTPPSSNATCYIRSNSIPNISRWWLQSFVFQATQMLRGLYVQWWQQGEDPSLNYFNRVDGITTPVRSTNQANDPGATDYIDFIEGEQDSSLFIVPSECPPPINSISEEGMFGSEEEWIHLLPAPFSHHVRAHMKKQRKY